VLDQQGDETIAIRTRTPYFTPSLAELAVTRIAASGEATTTSIAPIDAPYGIFGGDGAVTSNGYLVAWNDGGRRRPLHRVCQGLSQTLDLRARSRRQLLAPEPFVVPVEALDAIFSINPIGRNHALFDAREGKPYVRIIDVAAQRATDPMPLPQNTDQLVHVDPGAGGSVVTLSLHAIRGAEMEGASTIVGELFLPPGARRHAF